MSRAFQSLAMRQRVAVRVSGFAKPTRYVPDFARLVLFVSAFLGVGQSWASSFDQSHRLFGTLLGRFVQGDLVDYAALQADPKPLDEYLDQLADVPEKDYMTFSEKQKIAFLINLYNASTLRLVID